MPYREAKQQNEVLVIRPGNWPMGVVLMLIFVFPFVWKTIETPTPTLIGASLAFGLPLLGITIWLFKQRIVLTVTPVELFLDEYSLGPWGRRTQKMQRPLEAALSIRERINGGAWEWVISADEGEFFGVRSEKRTAEMDLQRVETFLGDCGIDVRIRD